MVKLSVRNSRFRFNDGVALLSWQGKKNRHKYQKLIALFVSCLLFFTVLPVSTFASVLSSSLSSPSLRPLPSSPPPSQEALLRMQQQEEEARKNAPKEMIAKRTKNSKKYVTPSGIYQTKTYPRAIHVKNDRFHYQCSIDCYGRTRQCSIFHRS
jgi:hypothetical protein